MIPCEGALSKLFELFVFSCFFQIPKRKVKHFPFPFLFLFFLDNLNNLNNLDNFYPFWGFSDFSNLSVMAPDPGIKNG